MWPPDDARTAVGPNDSNVRLDGRAFEFDSNGGGCAADHARDGGDGADLPDGSVVVDEVTRADAIAEQARLVPAAVGRFLPVTGVAARSLVGLTAPPLASVNGSPRLGLTVPPLAGENRPLAGQNGQPRAGATVPPVGLTAPSLVGLTATPRAVTIPSVVRAGRSHIEVTPAATAETTVKQFGARSIAALPGAGPLSTFLVDPAVTDVLVNGVDVWIDRGAGLVRCDFTFSSDLQVRRLAQRLAAACGRRLDEGSPYVDARLSDGTRLHAVLPPVATDGPYLSLRTFREHAFSLNDLVGVGTLSESGAEMLGAIVAARLSYLVSGGTGSGKTTLLATLLSEVPHDERIVIVEDAAELRPHHPHVVGLQARTANVEGAGAIGLRDLLRQALRMRPDRLVVGECRGAEVVDLLGALNTGHEGGAGTLHANTAADVPARLEALGLLSGVPRAALHAQIAAALHVAVHMRRMPAGRLLDEIVLLAPSRDGRAVASVSAWHRLGGVRPGAVPLANLMTSRGVRPPTALLAGRP
jgi:pilus assembly protein CpaF